MKTSISKRFSTYLWCKVRQLLNSHTLFIAKELHDGTVICEWKLSKVDRLRVKYSKSFFYAIRIFDISSSGSKSNSTCIMKEIQIGKNLNTFSFALPSISRKYILELGFRKRNGEWREFSSTNLFLSLRKQKKMEVLQEKDWFSSFDKLKESFLEPHEISYQLSMDSLLGGSENLNEGFTSSAKGRK